MVLPEPQNKYDVFGMALEKTGEAQFVSLLKILATFVLIVASCSPACNTSATNNMTHGTVPQAPPPPTKLYQVTIDGKYGFIDQNGNLKFTLPDDVYTIGQFSEGLAVVAKRVPNTHGRWGFIDETGKLVIDAKFNNAKPFSEGLAAVIDVVSGKAGYVDRSGRIVIQPQFPVGGTVSDFAFSEGLAPVLHDNGKWGYIDKTGKFVIEPRFTHALPFAEGRGLVSIAEPAYSIDYKWGFVDKLGRLIVPTRHDGAEQFSEGLAAVLLRNKVGFIELGGKTVIEPQFEPDGGCPGAMGRVGSSRFVDGLAPVQINRKWGFIDRAGKWMIKPEFDCAEPFSEGLAVIGVREQGSWRFGYIDKTGAIVIKPQFAYARMFVNNLAMVGLGMTDDAIALKSMQDMQAGKPEAQIEKEVKELEMKYGYIDKSGKFIWKPTK